MLLRAAHQIFSFTEIYVTYYYILWNISTGFWSSFLFLLQVQNRLITTRSWLVNAVLLLELGKIPTQKQTAPPPSPPTAPWSVIFSLLNCFLKHFRYFIHKYWHIFQKSFLHFQYILIIHAIVFAKFFLLHLTYFSLGLNGRS